MDTIAQVAEAMQTVLTQDARRLGRATGFVQRSGKLGGDGFVQTLVFSFQANPQASYSEMSQTAGALGIEISPQAIEQRFSETAASFVKQVLERAVAQVITSRPAAIPMLQRFRGVYLRDSSVVSLPEELVGVWPGVGGSSGATAALKVQVSFDYSTGQVQGPILQAGRSQDQTSPFQAAEGPAGTLRLADLGFFDLAQFAADDQDGIYWLSRLKVGTAVYAAEGQRLDLIAWLKSHATPVLDVMVEVGVHQRLRCRLIAVQVPQEVADRRRQRLKEYARKKQAPLTDEQLTWAEWTLVITNIPETLLSLREALVLLRVRWQIELLFKLWKSHGQIDDWPSQKPWRILCEIYAKLIGLIILHWTTLQNLWQYPNRSLVKAAQVMRKYALALAGALSDKTELSKVLTRLQKCLGAGCRMNTRKAHPNTYQLLLDVSLA